MSRCGDTTLPRLPFTTNVTVSASDTVAPLLVEKRKATVSPPSSAYRVIWNRL